MIFSEQILQEIKERNDILNVVSANVKLTKRGVHYFGLCPFHVEKTPSFSINSQKQTFTCFGCNASGDCIEFIKKIKNFTFNESVEYLANLAGIHLNISNEPDHQSFLKKINSLLLQHYKKLLFSDKGKIARDYLKTRHIEDSLWDIFNLGYCYDENYAVYNLLLNNEITEKQIEESGVLSKKNIPVMFDRLIFPILDHRNTCVGFGGRSLNDSNKVKYLNSKESVLFKKRQILYNANIAFHENTPLILTEGYFDVISMYKAGIKSTVATLGTAISDDQILLCWKHCTEPIVAFDGDNAGKKAAEKLMEKALNLLSSAGNSFKFLQLPDKLDLDEIVNSNLDMQTLLDTSIQMKDFLLSKYYSMEQDTPEKKAYLFKVIDEDLQKIPDKQVRSFYAEFLKSSIFPEINQNFKKKYSTGKNKNIINPPKLKINTEKFQKFLFAIVIKHPNVLDFVYDKFASINYLPKLRDTILSLYTENRENLFENLQKMGYNEALELIFAEDILLHTNFSCDASSKDIVTEWCGVYDRHCLMQFEMNEVCSSLKENFSEKRWELLKYLKGSNTCL